MAACFDNRILAPLRFEMILRLAKRDAGPHFQMSQHFPRKIDMPIQTSADCCPAERQLAKSFDRSLRAFLGISNLLRVTGKFLSQPNRRRVH